MANQAEEVDTAFHQATGSNQVHLEEGTSAISTVEQVLVQVPAVEEEEDTAVEVVHRVDMVVHKVEEVDTRIEIRNVCAISPTLRASRVRCRLCAKLHPRCPFRQPALDAERGRRGRSMYINTDFHSSSCQLFHDFFTTEVGMVGPLRCVLFAILIPRRRCRLDFNSGGDRYSEYIFRCVIHHRLHSRWI